MGFPYVWGGTSERTQTLFGVTSRGGFDCSGFAWRVYRLERYQGGARLQDILLGRTASQMASEVPRSARIGRAGLRPGDLVFFSEEGLQARPADVSHMGIYVGGGWFMHSSSQGTTLWRTYKSVQGTSRFAMRRVHQRGDIYPVFRELFQNLKFRQAMSVAIDREEINQIAYLGRANALIVVPERETSLSADDEVDVLVLP